MTSFKNKLNEELGEAPRFTKALQERIVRNAAQQQHKQKYKWQYPAMILGTIMTLLILIASGPWQQTKDAQHSSIVELAQKEEIQQWSFIQNWDEESFKAGRHGWVIGQQEYAKGTETILLENVLQKAVIAQIANDYHVVSNVWIEFSGGQAVKVKMYKSNEQLAFLDVKTNIFYKVTDEEAISAFIGFTSKETAFNSNAFLLLLVGLIGIFFIGWVAERVVRKKFNIPKEPKYVNKNHQRAVFIFKFIGVIVLMLFNLKNWFIYIAADFTLIFVSMLFLVAIEYYFGRHEKRHYVAITTSVYILIVFIAFVIWVQ